MYPRRSRSTERACHATDSCFTATSKRCHSLREHGCVCQRAPTSKDEDMGIGFKKTIATLAVAGALTLGGGAIADAAPDRAPLPAVAGMTESDAVQALSDAGFSDVSSDYDRPDATVVGTNFQAGDKVSENAAILLIVGAG
ncbi:PASTA domain-containing protein [Rhodococcus sp. 1R11]|nr:PASTA domain-containing protein [Rhodococcus sp. 1R11]